MGRSWSWKYQDTAQGYLLHTNGNFLSRPHRQQWASLCSKRGFGFELAQPNGFQTPTNLFWVPGAFMRPAQRITRGGSADSALPALHAAADPGSSGAVSWSSLLSAALQLQWRDYETPWYFLGFKMPFTLTQKTLRHSKLNVGQQDMSPLLIPYKMAFGNYCWKWQPQTCVPTFLYNIYNLWISGKYSRFFQSFTIQILLFFFTKISWIFQRSEKHYFSRRELLITRFKTKWALMPFFAQTCQNILDCVSTIPKMNLLALPSPGEEQQFSTALP